MPLLLLSIFLFVSNSFAGLEKVSAKNLNLEYIFPHGHGEVDKLAINISLVDQSYPVEIERIEDTYVLRTPMLDFTWTKPWTIAKSLERLMLKELNGTLGGETHELAASSVVYRPKNDGDYKLTNLKVKCQGPSVDPLIENRIMDDCREQMVMTMDRFEIPFNLLWSGIVSSLPKTLEEEVEDMPLKDFYLGAKKGEFYMYFLARYVVTAGLRSWGTFHYENEHQTLVLKVSLIKFGVIPVTYLVMNELKKQISSPSVKIDPPYIRIDL